MMSHNALTRRIVLVAGIAGALGVIMGSFGAHGLEAFLSNGGMEAEQVSKRLDQFDVGVRYHLIHSVALLALAGLSAGSVSRRRWIARLFVLGLLLFSGSLYLLVLTDTPVLGAITPLGGLCWIVAWLLLPWMAWSVTTE